MPADTMNPATAVTWGPFIQAAYDQFASDPGQSNPAPIKNMPAGYTLVEPSAYLCELWDRRQCDGCEQQRRGRARRAAVVVRIPAARRG
jgi:hypothetical protein